MSRQRLEMKDVRAASGVVGSRQSMRRRRSSLRSLMWSAMSHAADVESIGVVLGKKGSVACVRAVRKDVLYMQ